MDEIGGEGSGSGSGEGSSVGLRDWRRRAERRPRWVLYSAEEACWSCELKLDRALLGGGDKIDGVKSSGGRLGGALLSSDTTCVTDVTLSSSSVNESVWTGARDLPLSSVRRDGPELELGVVMLVV